MSEEAKRFLTLYTSEYFRSQNFLDEALTTAQKELKEDLQKIVSGQDKSPQAYMRLVMNLVESGVWISKSSWNFLGAATRIPNLYPLFTNENHREIIETVVDNQKSYFTHEQLFTAVFEELNYHYVDPNYKTPLKFPKIEATIALIPGVVNEFYRQVPFERGVQNICELYGLKYTVLRVHGAKSTKDNAQNLKELLNEYTEKNPDEKLWLIAYSKGGVDALRFLKENKELAEEKIVGISTIATPIMGNQRARHNLFNILSPLHKDFQRTLTDKYQTGWFRKSYRELPKIFYSSLALEAQWYQTHVWMLLAKMFFNSKESNDGVVDVKSAKFPDYFKAYHLGKIKGHHLVGLRYSQFNQEALIESHIIVLHYLGLLA